MCEAHEDPFFAIANHGTPLQPTVTIAVAILPFDTIRFFNHALPTYLKPTTLSELITHTFHACTSSCQTNNLNPIPPPASSPPRPARSSAYRSGRKPHTANSIVIRVRDLSRNTTRPNRTTHIPVAQYPSFAPPLRPGLIIRQSHVAPPPPSSSSSEVVSTQRQSRPVESAIFSESAWESLLRRLRVSYRCPRHRSAEASH